MRRRRISCAFAAAVSIAVLWIGAVPGGAETDQDLLQMLKDGSAQAIASVRSGVGKVTVHKMVSRNGTTLETDTVYTIAFSGTKFRMDGETTYVRNEGAPIPGGTRRAPKPGERVRQIVAFDGTTVTRLDPGKGLATIGDAMSTVGRLATAAFLQVAPSSYRSVDIAKMSRNLGIEPNVVRRESVAGRDYVMVELTEERRLRDARMVHRVYQLRFSLGSGFVVPEFRIRTDAGTAGQSILLTQVLTNVRASTGNDWIPSVVTVEEYRPDEKTGEYLKTVSSIVSFDADFDINVPVDEDQFSLKLPSGTTVINEVLDLEYSIP